MNGCPCEEISDTNDALRGRDNLLLSPTSYLRLTPAQEAVLLIGPAQLQFQHQKLQFMASHQNSKTYFGITKYGMKCGGWGTKLKSLMTLNMKPMLINQIVKGRSS